MEHEYKNKIRFLRCKVRFGPLQFVMKFADRKIMVAGYRAQHSAMVQRRNVVNGFTWRHESLSDYNSNEGLRIQELNLNDYKINS